MPPPPAEIDRLVALLHPEALWLFGSRAEDRADATTFRDQTPGGRIAAAADDIDALLLVARDALV